MPHKSKLQRSRRLNYHLGRESMKNVREEDIQGDYA